MPSPERHKQPRTETKDPGLEATASSAEDPLNRIETEALEALTERLKLKEQYYAQLKVLDRSGLLELFPPTGEHPKPELGVVGIDGQNYFLPAYEDVLKRLQDPEKRKLIEQKAEQGFTKLLIVPFALPLAILIERYKQTLLRVNQESGLKATDGSALELNLEDPLYVWDKLIQADNPQTPQDQQIEYGVTNYDGPTKEARGGRHKSELLQEDPGNGWHFLLTEDIADLPAEGQGKTISGRQQLEANKSPKEYLNLLQTKEQHQGESGLTPEAALTDWQAYLQEKQTVRDDWQGRGKVNWLVGNYLSGDAPVFSWLRGNRRPYLLRINPGYRGEDCGCRPAARF